MKVAQMDWIIFFNPFTHEKKLIHYAINEIAIADKKFVYRMGSIVNKIR